MKKIQLVSLVITTLLFTACEKPASPEEEGEEIRPQEYSDEEEVKIFETNFETNKEVGIDTSDWQTFDNQKEGVAILKNLKYPKDWYTYNFAGGTSVGVYFSDGGSYVEQSLSEGEIIDSLKHTESTENQRENECKLFLTYNGETEKYTSTKTNTKQEEGSKELCDMILNELEQGVEQHVDEKKETRILLTPDLIDSLMDSMDPMDRCDMSFNFDVADSEKTYRNMDLDIQFTAPYSENWGTEEYYLAPYDTEGESVFFGPIGAFEGCGWSRIYRMNILPHRSADEILGELGDINKPEVKSINDLLLVEHTQEFCGSSIIEVIGENNNYQFSVICGEAFDELEEIVKTIQWLES